MPRPSHPAHVRARAVELLRQGRPHRDVQATLAQEGHRVSAGWLSGVAVATGPRRRLPPLPAARVARSPAAPAPQWDGSPLADEVREDLAREPEVARAVDAHGGSVVAAWLASDDLEIACPGSLPPTIPTVVSALRDPRELVRLVLHACDDDAVAARALLEATMSRLG